MPKCMTCSSPHADPDWGQCFECFCADRPSGKYPEPTDADICASHGHSEYHDGGGFCYCGEQAYFPAVEQAYPNRIWTVRNA